MKRMILITLCMMLVPGLTIAAEPSAESVIGDALDQMRGLTSESVNTMTIHRPDWERTMTIKGYTSGRENSIFWVLSPPKDEGNGTLKQQNEMWTYNPKVNRVIKLPPSMMAQSWMGSDFSNDDLAKSDTIVNDYNHQLTSTKTVNGKKVYVIESPAKQQAPVIWGKLRFEIREDNVLLKEEFFDEDGELVKTMDTLEIKTMGGRILPATWKIYKTDVDDEYTLLVVDEIKFNIDLPANLFTRSALKNPPR